MKFFILVFVFSLLPALPAFAALEGSYQLQKGPEQCPNGNISLKTDSKSSNRNLIFGGSLSWSLNAEESGVTEEKTDGGCTYKTVYSKSENQFQITTSRLACPDVKENSSIKETLTLSKNILIYKNLNETTKHSLECFYRKN